MNGFVGEVELDLVNCVVGLGVSGCSGAGVGKQGEFNGVRVFGRDGSCEFGVDDGPGSLGRRVNGEGVGKEGSSWWERGVQAFSYKPFPGRELLAFFFSGHSRVWCPSAAQ